MDRNELARLLRKEIPVLKEELHRLYSDLDRRFGLHGAQIPVNFIFDDSLLGSYSPARGDEDECFTFSLLFTGRAVEKPLIAEDRRDLYLHEYAHYMQYHYDIPADMLYEPGIHGSAWRYCCSLTGAAPTPYYKVGEGLLKHDYDKALRDPWKDPNIALKGQYRREQAYRDKQNGTVRFHEGDSITHKTFGEGVIEGIEQKPGAVRLKIRFGDQLKIIDQAWLLKSMLR